MSQDGRSMPARRATAAPNDHAEALHALGALYLRQGYPKQGLALLLAARRFTPPSLELSQTTIQAYLLSGAPKKAIDLLDTIEPSLTTAADRAAAAVLRSRGLLALGRVRDAQAVFDRATQLALRAAA